MLKSKSITCQNLNLLWVKIQAILASLTLTRDIFKVKYDLNFDT